ncbi:hypothetical protein V3C99_009424, partial [Haemonchus contortus]
CRLEMSSKTTSKNSRKRTGKTSHEQSGASQSKKTPLGLQNKRAKGSPSHIDSAKGSTGDKNVSIPDSVKIPKFITEFYQFAASLRPEEPCLAFKKLKSARLVGLFELLNGELSTLSDDELLLHYRHQTDLPEMQTVLVSDIGRYCLWRDIPNSEDGLVVYVPNEDRFPKIEIVGNRMEHAIVHLAGKAKEAVEPFLPKSTEVGALKQQMRTACNQRNKTKLGKAPSGAGLWVEVVNDVGYRPISEDAGKIRKTLDLLCSSDDESLRKCKMQWLMELITFAQIATDECDFGMGLELGQWLFLANHEPLDKFAHRLLGIAYSMLGRQEYKKIVDLQMAPGIRRRTDLDARKKTPV